LGVLRRVSSASKHAHRSLTPEDGQLAMVERFEAARIPRHTPATRHFYLLGGGRIPSPCGQHFQGLHHQGTHRGKYVCPGRRHFLDDTCHCHILDAETIDADVWARVVRLLTDPARLARCRPADQITLIGSTPTLEESIALAEVAVTAARADLTHAAVELVHARLPGDAIAAATTELTSRLDEAEAARNEFLQRRNEATDPVRLQRLRQGADLVAARLVRLDSTHRRALSEMLALKSTVSDWAQCAVCRGKGKLTGARGGLRCPSCAGGRYVPNLFVTCWWADDAYEALAR
jgi:hypothetical protein